MRFLAGALAAAALTAGSTAVAQSFNFNTGSDAGLTQYNPLSGFGLGASFTFPGGDSYRITAPGVPAELTGLLGGNRAGAVLTGSIHGDSSSWLDIKAWGPGLDQSIGLVARVQQPGLGTTDGYGLLLFPTLGVLIFNEFVNEQVIVLPNAGNNFVTLAPGQDYRLRFDVAGSTLTGSLYSLADLTTPLTTITAVDTSLDTGLNALLVAGSLNSPTTAIDATVDNFIVEGTPPSPVPEPTEYAAAFGFALAGFALWRRRR